MNETTCTAILGVAVLAFIGWLAWLETQENLAKAHACSCMYCQPEK